MSFISPIPCESGSGPGPGPGPVEECCPVTFTGFCLSDGTPIGIVVLDDTQIGWFNLLTAIFTPGPPPSGTEPCSPPAGPLETCIDCLTDSITACVSYDYVEDAAHTSGDIGAFTLGVRNDAATVITSANGDYSPFATDSAGRIGISDLGGPITVKITERSSEVRGRLHVDKSIENVSVFPATIHIVTPGHIFHLLSIGVTGLNSSTTVNGRLVIRDDTTIKIPYLVGQGGQIAITSAAFLEPIPFSTNVNIQQLGGTNTVSIYIVGYEEPI